VSSLHSRISGIWALMSPAAAGRSEATLIRDQARLEDYEQRRATELPCERCAISAVVSDAIAGIRKPPRVQTWSVCEWPLAIRLPRRWSLHPTWGHKNAAKLAK